MILVLSIGQFFYAILSEYKSLFRNKCNIFHDKIESIFPHCLNNYLL